MKKDDQGVQRMLMDPDQPLALRRALLGQLLADESPQSDKALARLFANGRDPHQEKTEQLARIIKALEEGPMRIGTYLADVGDGGCAAPRAPRVEVLLGDGQPVYAVVPDPEAVGELRRGDSVLLDAQAKAVLGRQRSAPRVGEQARLLRQIDDGIVEVDFEHQGRWFYRASARLTDELRSGQVRPGGQVVICPQRLMAFCGVPATRDNDHFRYLDRRPPPDVCIHRDIADPPKYVAELLEHVRREMYEPARAREYRIHRLRTVFLRGVSGSGKTLSIEGFVRATYELIAEATGLGLDEVPPRVLRLRASEVLSKWYGQAESNVDRFFDEVEELSEQPVRGRDGVEHEAPVVVVAEEIEGLTRERGTGDAADGRVQATILQRLDATARALRDRLIVVLCTSNVPQLLDPAFVRRAGGSAEDFGRLGRRGFAAVLRKQLAGIPFARGDNGRDPVESATAALTAWLYGKNGDGPVVEVQFTGSTRPQPRHRRDFLTGSTVERAVQRAAARALRLEEESGERGGLTTELLAEALVEQVGAVVAHLDAANAHHYMEVPRGSRIATVRPVADPLPPFDLEGGG